MDIVITLSDGDVSSLLADMTTLDPVTGQAIVPDLTEALPALVRHTIIEPILARQQTYRVARLGAVTGQQSPALLDALLNADPTTAAAAIQAALAVVAPSPTTSAR